MITSAASETLEENSGKVGCSLLLNNPNFGGHICFMVVFRMQHNELVSNSISKFTSPPCGECLINLLEQAKDILL